jgi:hypothetical protein
MRFTCASAVVVVAVAAIVVGPSSAAAGESAGSHDKDDVAHQLDVRSVVISETSTNFTRITVRFWNRVPAWLIRRNGVWVEASFYRFRIFRNADGRLRIRGGDLASKCGGCVTRRARHPDPHTYVGTHYVYGTEPPPDELRAVTFGKPDCDGRCKWFETGQRIDSTPWAPI